MINQPPWNPITILSLIPRKYLILAFIGLIILLAASSCGNFPGPSRDDFPF